MILPFSQYWPERMGELAGQPNYFIEKIWSGLNHFAGEREWTCLNNNYKMYHKIQFGANWEEEYPSIARGNMPKLHTIREDPHNRWKPGMKIHFVINNRTKNRFQFAPVMECKSVQEIEFQYWNKCSDYPNIIIDKHYEYHAYEKDGFEFMEQLAINDGFPSVDAFFQYFNTDFKGKLIHWTNLKH